MVDTSPTIEKNEHDHYSVVTLMGLGLSGPGEIKQRESHRGNFWLYGYYPPEIEGIFNGEEYKSQVLEDSRRYRVVIVPGGAVAKIVENVGRHDSVKLRTLLKIVSDEFGYDVLKAGAIPRLLETLPLLCDGYGVSRLVGFHQPISYKRRKYLFGSDADFSSLLRLYPANDLVYRPDKYNLVFGGD